MATVGSKNQPLVSTTDAFNPPNDINTLANWVATNYANFKVLTGATTHASLTGADVFQGLLVYEASTGQFWRYDGGWFIEPLGTPPRAVMTKTTTQSIATGGSGAVVTGWTLGTARAFTTNATSGTITIPYSGRYNVFAQIVFAGSGASTTYCMTQLLVNGSASVRSHVPGISASVFVPIAAVGQYYSAGDVLSINALQTSGSAQNVTATSTFIVEYVGQ